MRPVWLKLCKYDVFIVTYRNFCYIKCGVHLVWSILSIWYLYFYFIGKLYQLESHLYGFNDHQGKINRKSSVMSQVASWRDLFPRCQWRQQPLIIINQNQECTPQNLVFLHRRQCVCCYGGTCLMPHQNGWWKCRKPEMVIKGSMGLHSNSN